MQNPIWPIVMMFPLPEGEPPKGKNKQLLDKKEHPELHRHLVEENGIYVFYDSSGRCVYLGKTKNTLWQRARFSLNNREIPLVLANPGDQRQVKKNSVPLYKVAAYFSAYGVEPDNLIDFFESLLVTAFPNDLHNVQMPKGIWATES